MRAQPVDFRFNADPVALKLVSHNKIVFRAATGSCLPKLKRKRNARCFALTDSFVSINVSTMKVRYPPVQFTAANEKKSNSRQQKKRKTMAL